MELVDQSIRERRSSHQTISDQPLVMKSTGILVPAVALVSMALSGAHSLHVATPDPDGNRTARVGDSIVGGALVAHGDGPPWMAHFVEQYPPWIAVCGGALISSRFVATAAHCIFSITPHSAHRVLMADVYVGPTNNTLMFNILALHKHPNYNPPRLDFDFGLVELTESTISAVTRPLALATAGVTYDKALAVFTGFGDTDGGRQPRRMRRLDMTVLSENQCRRFAKNLYHRSFLCANSVDPGGFCNGDSGSPLVTLINSWPILIGVASFRLAKSAFCHASNNNSDIYSRISESLPFIRQTLEKYSRK